MRDIAGHRRGDDRRDEASGYSEGGLGSRKMHRARLREEQSPNDCRRQPQGREGEITIVCSSAIMGEMEGYQQSYGVAINNEMLRRCPAREPPARFRHLDGHVNGWMGGQCAPTITSILFTSSGFSLVIIKLWDMELLIRRWLEESICIEWGRHVMFPPSALVVLLRLERLIKV